MPDYVGKTIANRYHVREFIGRGGMAEVYKVWDQSRSVFLALKLLREDLAEDIVFLRRFKREAQALTRLQHPNIVRCYGFEQDIEAVYILMDFIDGTTLRKEIIKRQHPFSEVELLSIVRPLCSSLHYAHTEGMVHCDIKPANIMLEKGGRVLLADFGIAQQLDAATSTMLGAGSPAYMAPEQVRGLEPTAQTDIYALGIVLYEMLTGGERPFTGERARTTGTTGEKVRWEQCNLAPLTPRHFNPNLPMDIEAIVLKSLAKYPEERYRSVLDLMQLLERAVQEGYTDRESAINKRMIPTEEKSKISHQQISEKSEREKREQISKGILPQEIQSLLDSPVERFRLLAVGELDELMLGEEKGLSKVAYETLKQIQETSYVKLPQKVNEHILDYEKARIDAIINEIEFAVEKGSWAQAEEKLIQLEQYGEEGQKNKHILKEQITDAKRIAQEREAAERAQHEAERQESEIERMLPEYKKALEKEDWRVARDVLHLIEGIGERGKRKAGELNPQLELLRQEAEQRQEAEHVLLENERRLSRIQHLKTQIEGKITHEYWEAAEKENQELAYLGEEGKRTAEELKTVLEESRRKAEKREEEKRYRQNVERRITEVNRLEKEMETALINRDWQRVENDLAKLDSLGKEGQDAAIIRRQKLAKVREDEERRGKEQQAEIERLNGEAEAAIQRAEWQQAKSIISSLAQYGIEGQTSAKKLDKRLSQAQREGEKQTRRQSTLEGTPRWIFGVILLVIVSLSGWLIGMWLNIQGEKSKNSEATRQVQQMLVQVETKEINLALTNKVVVSATMMETALAIQTIMPTTSATVKYTETPQAGEVKENEKDGAEMVYVPAGDFLMGSNNDVEHDVNPQHTVYLDEYWIYKTEVTNAQYAQCCGVGICSKPGDTMNYTESSYAQHPVVNVDWEQAKGYCEWAGGRLPNEAEWEKAARGTDGRRYAWGSQGVSGELLNYCDANCEMEYAHKSFDDGNKETAAVGSYPAGASPYGALDMAGNVWEWVQDWYGEKYYANAPKDNPSGPTSGEYRVLRGGSWASGYRYVSSTYRLQDISSFRRSDSGFRCASSEILTLQTPIDTDKQSAPLSVSTLTPVVPSQTPLATSSLKLDIGSTQVSPIDGAGMVYVPAGEFLMGSDNGDDDEKPQHTVYLDEYWIYKTEVTNSQYAKCMGAGSCSKPSYPEEYYDSSYAQNPVVFVDRWQAKEYCAWARGRLPSEAEWEKAARGIDGRTYPWGNQEPTCSLANYDVCGGKTKEVGSLAPGASPYGALDMAGNVWEWVNDWYGVDYYANSPKDNPTGPTSGKFRVLRGGSWGYEARNFRSANRNWYDPMVRNNYYGFRCASSDTITIQTPIDTDKQSTPLSVSTLTPVVPSQTPLATSSLKLDIGSTQVSSKDGMVSVYVPAGEFLMGSNDADMSALSDEKPQHKVYLDSFWIDKTEVTNTIYKHCVEEGACKTPSTLLYYDIKEYEDHPVQYVNWMQARSYCEWAGRRLPTEAEWEKAARGVDGRLYPWGNSSPSLSKVNYNCVPCKYKTKSIGSYPSGASPYGALDMAGNVWEWTNDWYSESFYKTSSADNPQGSETGERKILRGGSWSNFHMNIRSAYRNGPPLGIEDVGFRCASSETLTLQKPIGSDKQSTPISVSTPTPVEPSKTPIAASYLTLGIGSTQVSHIDGAGMVYVPAGEFLMGSDNGEEYEKPQHTVYLDTYWIYKTEVTNAQYGKCVTAGSCSKPKNYYDYDKGSYAQHPVVNVDWEQAKGYCAWAGGRLPSEAEWEKAARGTDGRMYPWGNQEATCSQANFRGCRGKTNEVGRLQQGVSPYGALDMAGNVWEWVNDWLGEGYYASSMRDNPTGPGTGEYHILRGGSWNNRQNLLQTSTRYWLDPTGWYNDGLGFRCVR